MTDKDEMANELNEFFKLDLNWGTMSGADLDTLYNTLLDDKKVAAIFGLDKLRADAKAAGGFLDQPLKKLGKNLKDRIDDVVEKRPIRTALQDLFGGGGE